MDGRWSAEFSKITAFHVTVLVIMLSAIASWLPEQLQTKTFEITFVLNFMVMWTTKSDLLFSFFPSLILVALNLEQPAISPANWPVGSRNYAASIIPTMDRVWLLWVSRIFNTDVYNASGQFTSAGGLRSFRRLHVLLLAPELHANKHRIDQSDYALMSGTGGSLLG